jgi:insertion element IS1 protein InsB
VAGEIFTSDGRKEDDPDICSPKDVTAKKPQPNFWEAEVRARGQYTPKKHLQTKAETYTLEGYKSLFRHFFARMRRKSKCYSKKMEMLKISILLLMHHRNGILYIFN